MVSVDWECINGASGYQVYTSRQKNGKYIKQCDYGNDAYGAYIPMTKNVKYWYKTRAYKIVDGKKIFAPWSDPKAFTLK